ncbi:hypothetical protein EHEL_091110 [Encephalitozoon hellem ATCC 50504]|uniref:Mannose-specific lectin ERGIC-53 n=1 Tax=Encephalitozoon hellem TaxID=27973 RepID=A0A9Q9C7J0_ENCHE|nr:uncharacterized protein EHEL_091110 [Encephalitozoon hellem ATCC 50504]AFM99006.1 hypothetical protein EHEL_091110 [Encephalitozoon hellem ATCC 50504]UTX44022.1 mannose-specific lectin ERGIC-53 [Encephalitozoon hellem]|eukprot:XP_003887987.1 hypothetical protein EHEL_091110 [Encephalitozoon hellem ATCC 50504]
MFAFLYALGCLCNDNVFVQEVSLLPPYVDEIGRFLNWKTSGEQVIKVHGKDSFVQLGYSSPNSSGAILASHPIGSEKFGIDMIIEIEEDGKEDGDDGMAVWISNEDTFNEGSCFGRSCSFKGLLIVIKPSGKSYIGVKAGDVLINPNNIVRSFDRIEYRNFPTGEKLVLRIEQKDYELSIYLGEPDNLSLVHSYRSNVVKEGDTLGVSAATDRSSTSFRIVGIEGYHLKNMGGMYTKEDVHSGGKLIWILLAAVVSVTAYYLYNIQIKKGN